MDYTLEVNGKMKRSFCLFFGLLLVLILASCTGSVTLPPATASFGSAQDKTVPTKNSHSSFLDYGSPNSLPQVCNCVLRFDHIGIEQGLSQSSVYIIFQDSHGFLWFGTQDGLNRYDGYTFKTYKPDPDVPSSISDRWITSIVEDRNGYLWIATRQGGLNRYDPGTEKFVHYLHHDSNPLSLMDNHINVLYIDQ